MKAVGSRCARRRVINEVDTRVDDGADEIYNSRGPESSIIWR